MWVYEKKLQYPVNIKQTNPKLAKIIISQYGGPYFKKIYKKSACKDFKILTGGIIIYTSDSLLPALRHRVHRVCQCVPDRCRICPE